MMTVFRQALIVALLGVSPSHADTGCRGHQIRKNLQILAAAKVPSARSMSFEGEKIPVLPDPVLRGMDIASITSHRGLKARLNLGTTPIFSLVLSPLGRQKFAAATQKHKGSRLIVAVGDRVLSAPVVQSTSKGQEISFSPGSTIKDASLDLFCENISEQN